MNRLLLALSSAVEYGRVKNFFASLSKGSSGGFLRRVMRDSYSPDRVERVVDDIENAAENGYNYIGLYAPLYDKSMDKKFPVLFTIPVRVGNSGVEFAQSVKVHLPHDGYNSESDEYEMISEMKKLKIFPVAVSLTSLTDVPYTYILKAAKDYPDLLG